MQTVFVLLAVEVKEVSDTKRRKREAVTSVLLEKKGWGACLLFPLVLC